MYTKVTVVREIKGEKKEQEMIFGTGRLTNDPPAVQSVGNNGARVLRGNKDHRFSIAFNNGRNKDATFYPVTAWAEQADNLAKLGFKGQEVEIAARIEVQNYNDAQGNPKSAEVLVVERFDVKQYKDNGNGSAGSNASQGGNATGGNADAGNQEPAFDGGAPVGGDDDIPF